MRKRHADRWKYNIFFYILRKEDVGELTSLNSKWLFILFVALLTMVLILNIDGPTLERHEKSVSNRESSRPTPRDLLVLQPLPLTSKEVEGQHLPDGILGEGAEDFRNVLPPDPVLLA